MNSFLHNCSWPRNQTPKIERGGRSLVLSVCLSEIFVYDHAFEVKDSDQGHKFRSIRGIVKVSDPY